MADIKEIHLIHLSHTDIGYTHDQPTVWDLYRRFLEQAINFAERDLGSEKAASFRWTIEATAPLLHWLESASDDRIDTLQRLESAGRIEVTGMLANIAPLYGPAEIEESLRPIEVLRDRYGFNIRHAINFDVNGQNWPLVDSLLDSGIEGLWMGINNHFGRAPNERPSLFRWEGPSGRTIPTLDGYHYSAGWNLGIGRDVEAFRTNWETVRDRLETVGYDLSTLPMPTYHPFGDNGPPFDRYCAFVESWNAHSAVQDGEYPRLKLSTPSIWWESIGSAARNAPVRSGDWTDYWNFGCLSSARETGITRESRRRLLTADAMEAVLGAVGSGQTERPAHRRSDRGTRQRAWRNLAYYDEHTWGADTAISDPRSEDTRTQWNHKAQYAHAARSHSKALQRDALAEVARYALERADTTGEENP